MRFTVYRAQDGFVVSPDCMQAPLAVQGSHPEICHCGTLDLPAGAALQLVDAVMRDGFAIVAPPDRVHAELDRMCTQRQLATPA